MPPSMASLQDYHVLTPKFSSEDPDIRYMTLVDLGKLLKKTNSTTLAREPGICSTIVENLIKLLDDSNGDVQNEAVKCIQPFTAKAPYEYLIRFMQRVVDLEASKSQDTTITATAARTLVLSLPHPVQGAIPDRAVTEAYSVISQVLLPKLVPQPQPQPVKMKTLINFESPKGVTIEALDLLGETLRAYGSLFTRDQLRTVEVCLSRVLNDDKTGPIAKKRAIASIARLSTHFSSSALSAFISVIVEDFRQSHITIQKRRLLISVLGAVAASTPTKFGPYLQTVGPFVLSALSQQELDDTYEAISEDKFDPATNDLKEAALLTIESFSTFCTTDMRLFTNEVVDAGLRYLSYNPSLVDASDEEMENDEDDGEDLIDEDEDFEQEEQFDDEDDASWKIRRSAGKVFSSLISTRSDLLENGPLFDQVLPALTKAFRDREESVQLEALRAVMLIVQKTTDTIPIQTTVITNGHTDDDTQPNARKRRRVDSIVVAPTEQQLPRGHASPSDGLPSPTSVARSELLRQSPTLLTGAINLLSSKSIPVRQAAISLLQAFIQLKHDSLTSQLNQVLKPVVEIVLSSHGTTVAQSVTTTGATTGTLRITALQFLSFVLDTHSSTSTSPYFEAVIKAIASAADDRNLKVASEALNAGESIIKALTPPRAFGYDNKSKQHVEAMFDLVYEKAKSNNIEAEVRNRAIQAIGVCIARVAQVANTLSADRHGKGLAFLRERLLVDATRIASVQAIDLILSTNQSGKIEASLVQDIALDLGGLLRKADRTIRSVSLGAIKKLTGNSSVSGLLKLESMKSLSSLLIYLYQLEGVNHIVLIMEILSDLVSLSSGQIVDESLIRVVCDIAIKSLAGHTLECFLELITSIGSAGTGKTLMSNLLQKVGVSGEPQVVGTTIGALLCSGGASIGIDIDSFVSEVRGKADDRRVALALIVLGEVASIQGSESKITPEIFVESLQSRSEEVQAAAATSLGRAAITNTQMFLPVLLKTFQEKTTKTTTALLSVKELLVQQNKSSSSLGSYSEPLWDNLLSSAKDDEARPLAAECIGRLAATEPAKLFPLLQDHLSNTQPGIRGAIIQAVRFAVSHSDEGSDETLRPYLVKMLVTMLQDKNVENKRMAMATLQYAARSKPQLVLPSCPQLLTYVTKTTEIDHSLIREVQMGPFKHKVDDGLEMRKAAFETLQAFVDLAYSQMDHPGLFDRLIAGLQDDHDVKKLTFMMITTLIKLDRVEVARRLDNIGECFRMILAIKLKDNAVKQETEKLSEIVHEVLILTVKLRNEFPEIVASSSNNAPGQAFRLYLNQLRNDWNNRLQAVEDELKKKQT